MTTAAALPQGEEIRLGEQELIVSKTDLKGHLTYVNEVFVRVSGYERSELLGQPHSIIRHPDMPGAVFKLLWDTISTGNEIFAYVKNATKTGGFYWVLAHVTPSYDAAGRIVGYHSNRRCPDRAAIRRVEPLYRDLRQIERSMSRKAEAAAASLAHLQDTLRGANLTYEEFVWRVIHGQKTGLIDE